MAEPDEFTQILFQKMQMVNPGIGDFELFEFQYGLENLVPRNGWETITLAQMIEIESQINSHDFYESIQLKPKIDEKLVIDKQVELMTQMLLKGIVKDYYRIEWINHHFFFDLRSFYFFHRTNYYNQVIQSWLGGKPYRTFNKNQDKLRQLVAVGYKAFKEANVEIDCMLIEILEKVINQNCKPFLIGIAGQTGAGKTEIVSRLQDEFVKMGLNFTSLEIDHFLTDRDEREAKGIDSLGKEALHFELFIQSLMELRKGNKVTIPQYDFIHATSSHSLDGSLKPGCSLGEVSPADLIFIEGNFPFLYPEVAKLIDLKVIYLTDDEIRLKRKWRRDIDYRKKYDLVYFINRYFREQFLMAEAAYIPQMQTCDLLVDTSKAEIWITPDLKETLYFDQIEKESKP